LFRGGRLTQASAGLGSTADAPLLQAALQFAQFGVVGGEFDRALE